MGDGTDLDSFLEAHPLTDQETRERRAAEAISDPDKEATLDGELVKRSTPSAAPILIQERKTATWD